MTGPRRARGRTIVVAVSLSALVACDVVGGLVLPPKDAGTNAQEVPEAAAPPVPDANDGCDHAFPPKPPTNAPEGAGDRDLLFAIEHVDFRSGKVGVDLDGVCTCTNNAPSSCKVSSSTPPCDQPGGRDNALGGILSNIKGVANFDIEGRVNELLVRGKSGLLVRVQGWNGEADDALVQVSFYPSRGVCTPYDADAGAVDADADAGDAGHVPSCVTPAFDASDKWAYDPTQIFGPDPSALTSKLTATRAYVSGGVLVAEVAGRMPLANLDLNLQAGVIMGRIGADPPTFTDGVIAGRWKLQDAFVALRHMRMGESGPALCNNPTYQIGEATICSLADIMDLPVSDDAGLRCNAISVGVSFQAAPASFGPPIVIDAFVDECAPAALPCQ